MTSISCSMQSIPLMERNFLKEGQKLSGFLCLIYLKSYFFQLSWLDWSLRYQKLESLKVDNLIIQIAKIDWFFGIDDLCNRLISVITWLQKTVQ